MLGQINHVAETARELDRCKVQVRRLNATIAERDEMINAQAESLERFRAFMKAFNEAERMSSQTLEWYERRSVRRKARAAITPADMGETE